jgi:hypothetical protein
MFLPSRLANVFLILYGPGTILAVVCMKRMKLRNTLLLASILTILGAVLRVIAAVQKDAGMSQSHTYMIMISGQCLGNNHLKLFRCTVHFNNQKQNKFLFKKYKTEN